MPPRRLLLFPHLLTLRQAPRGQPTLTAPCSGIGRMIMVVSINGCYLSVGLILSGFFSRPKFLLELRKPHARQRLYVGFCLWPEEADLRGPSR